MRVDDAHGQPPTIPFWLGEAPARTDELSHAVSRLREDIAGAARTDEATSEARSNGRAGHRPVRAGRGTAGRLSCLGRTRALGTLPTQKTIVLERFFDESGGMQLVIHSPFGSRINRAWGLALRKRFCSKFNFELQAAATEDAIVLSLSTSHSFPLDERGALPAREDRAAAARSGDARCADVRRALALDRRQRRWRCRAFAAARRCPRRCSGCARRI